MNKVKDTIKNIKLNLIIKIAAITFCFAAIFCVTKIVYAKETYGYEMPEIIRVALTNGFSSKQKIDILNEDIELGYFVKEDDDKEKYISLKEYSCENGYYFMYNDSNRYMSETYEDFDEMMTIIEETEYSNDLLPLYLGYNNYKIVTKPNREANELCQTLYDTMEGSIVMISGDNKELAIFDGNAPIIKDEDEEPIQLSKIKSYRGYIKLIKGIEGITAVNYINFDEYLYGVITCEMPQSWDIEALKAQALAARTYAFKRILLDRYNEYDLLDSTYDQVYGGVAGESNNSIKAADETSHEIIIYVGDNERYYGKLIDAYFSSCDGGVTESSENVWTAALPYCISKVDPYEKENKYTNWTLKFTISDLQNAMKVKNQKIGTITGCTVTTTSQSNRVLSFNIIGTEGTFKVSKDNIRTFFNTYMEGTCYSTNFELYSGSNPKMIKEESDNETYVINDIATTSQNKKLKDLYIYNPSNEGVSKINDTVCVLSSNSNEVTELELTKIEEVEDKTYSLSKGEYLIVGSGFGHGVGLSQYGAKDMAEEGFTYDEIIKFYYTDVDIVTID